METPPVEKKKMSLWLRVLIGICGIIAIVGGIAQMKKGVGEIRGSATDPQIKQLLADAEIAVEKGNKKTAEAMPLFPSLDQAR